MSRQALIEREKKRAKLRNKYANKRKELMEIISDYSGSVSDEQRFEAQFALQKLPRNSSLVRKRSRCALTGRPRGTFRKFGIARNKLRQLALKGEVPGIIKASW